MDCFGIRSCSNINNSKEFAAKQINLYLAINLVSRNLHLGAYLGAPLLNEKENECLKGM